jgi:hypothetical protein
MRICHCGKRISESAYSCAFCGQRFTPVPALPLGVLLPVLSLVIIAHSCMH